jgi:hypothetical protein
MRTTSSRVCRSLAIALLVGSGMFASVVDAADKNASSSQSLSSNIDAEARRVLSQVKTTSYSHTTHVDESQGLYEVDCSGFVDLVLKAAAPESLAKLDSRRTHKRPLADDYEQTFEDAASKTGNGAAWQNVAQVADARPGDIIAWKNPAHKTGEHTNTGHVMVIDSRPVEDNSGSRYGQNAGSTYRITVIDSTASPHGFDSRPEGQSGIGRGTIWLVVDSAGKPTGYRWKSPRGSLHSAPIAIGRAVGGE